MIVTFGPAESGHGPLMWGQTAIWEVIRWMPPGDSSLNIPASLDVPAHCSLDDIGSAVRTLIERHAALRTRLCGPEDEPHQVVADSGSIDITVEELTDGGLSAAEIGARLREQPFDTAQDLPIRISVITRAGQPKQIVFSFSHVAVDGWSVAIVVRDLAKLLDGRTALDPRAQQPLQRAAYERSPEAQRKAARALRFWESAVRELPPVMLEDLRRQGRADLEWSEIQSDALAAAARLLSASARIPSSLVIQAATAAVLGSWLKENDVALRLIVATRFRPETQELVGPFNQNALFRIVLREAEPFTSFLSRCGAANLRAYQHCEYEPRSLERLIAEVAAERGITADGYCFFNDVRFDFGTPTGQPAETDPSALRDRTRLRVPGFDIEQKGSKFFVYLHELADTAKVTLCADRRFLDGRSAAEFLLAVEDLLVQESTSFAAVRPNP